MEHYTRLPLTGTLNTRDLGGIPTPSGPTPWQTFLRSDGLQNINIPDIQFLQNYGVTRIIDLRSAEELLQQPDPVTETIQYFNIPLMIGDVADATQNLSSHSFDLGDFYIGLLEERSSQLRLIFELLAENSGATLFHCAAGKDRTGVVAALLLELAEAAYPDIIADYQVTHTFLAADSRFQSVQTTFDPTLLRSDAQNMSRFLNHLAHHYGNAGTYFRQAGLSSEHLHLLQQKLNRKLTVKAVNE